MTRRYIFVAILSAVPALVSAQRTKAATHTPMFEKDKSPQGPSLRARDVEDASPLRMLIDKRKDLKLSDAQVDSLKAMESRLKDKNAILLKAVDSLVREQKPPLNATDESTARIRNAQRGLQETLRSVDENYDAATKEAVAGFDADQQKTATELLGKHKEESSKRLRDRMRGS